MGSTLTLESKTQNMLHVENVATTCDPQPIGPSSNTIIIEIDELGSKLLDVQASKKKKLEWQV